MTKNQMLTIEVVVIAVLVLLLAVKFQHKTEQNKWLEEGEHGVAEVSEDGKTIKTPDGRIIIVNDGTEPTGKPEPHGEATPTPASYMTEEERKVAALSADDLARYRAAISYEVPENIAFAKVQESLSVREKADGDSKQVGTLAPYNYCIVESVEGEWAKITSGSISGYCRASYLMMGEEAVLYAKETVQCKATTRTSANIRSAPTTTQDNVVGSAKKGNTYNVTKAAVLSDDPDAPLFVEIENGDKLAYIAMGLVTISYGWTPGKAAK